MSGGRGVPALFIFLSLFFILIFGVGITVWVADVSDEEMTQGYRNLLVMSDWMVKSSVGAILGFAGGARLTSRNWNGQAS